MYQFPLILAGNELAGAYWLVKLTPLTVRLARFQELMKDRLLICQQKVPAPLNSNGAVMIALTGLQAVLCVGVIVGVCVRVGVFVTTVFVGVGVRVGVLVTPVGVKVGVLVRVAVGVRVGVLVTTVAVGVFVGPVTGSLPHVRDPLTYAGTLNQSV
jgi:hypothetical protein